MSIDIKPRGSPNSINPNSRGVIPVAILTNAGFDASTVDPETILFAGASPSRSAMEDVDGDGDQDMILHVRTQQTTIEEGDTEACLTGLTFGGQPIVGCDSVRIVPPNADADGDSQGSVYLSDDVEASVGTDQLRGCSGPGIDAWPPDTNADNEVSILDLLPYGGKLSAGLGDPRYQARLDLVFDGTLTILDAAAVAVFYGLTCMEANPDADSDGFLNLHELFVGTDALDNCPDGLMDDAWPADMAASVGYGKHDGTVNILDVVQLTPPYFNQKTHQKYYSERKDFNGDGYINILDVVRVTPPTFNTVCAQ